jgi:hypothetical protein
MYAVRRISCAVVVSLSWWDSECWNGSCASLVWVLCEIVLIDGRREFEVAGRDECGVARMRRCE